MGAVDKQNITGFELGKKFQIDILNLSFNQRLQGRDAVSIAKKLARKGIDTDQSRILIFGSSLPEHERRKTATHLYDQLRLKMADHTVSDQCINATKRPLLAGPRLYCKVVIFVAEF